MRALIEGVVLAAISALAIWAVLEVPAAAPGETWAGIVPFGAAIVLLALSLMMIFAARGSLVAPSEIVPQSDSEATAGTKTQKGAVGGVLVLFVVAILYQQSFRWFGYVLPTAIAAPVVLHLFGVRSMIGLALSVILCPLVFYIIFFVLLGVFPPYGEVFDLLDVIRS